VQVPGIQAERRDDDEAEADRVDHEAPADADRADQDRRDGRPDDPGDVHRGAVQRHRVAHQVAADYFLGERLPRRVVHRAEDAEQAQRLPGHVPAEVQHRQGRNGWIWPGVASWLWSLAAR
jgi:hypothetical protein